MRTVARPSFHKNLLVRLLLLLVFAAIRLGLLQTPAYATAWQVWHCDPNTGPSLVEATLMDCGNYGELRGDNGPAWYFVDSETSPDDSGYGAFISSEGKTVEVYGDVNVIIGDNTKWIAKRIHLNNGAKLTLWSETGNKNTRGKLSVKTTKDHEAALSVGEGGEGGWRRRANNRLRAPRQHGGRARARRRRARPFGHLRPHPGAPPQVTN